MWLKKKFSRICAFFLVLAIGISCCSIEPYKAAALKSGKSGKFLALSSDELVNVAYSFSSGYIDLSDPDCSAHVDTSYLRFRIWVYFGDILPSGSEVTVSAEIRNGPGTIGTVQGFFADRNGNDIYASQSLSQKGTFSFANGGLTTTDTTFVLTGDASAFVFDITYSSRSVSQMYLDVTKLLLRCTYQDVVVSELEDLNTTSNSVLDNLKNIVLSFTNLPSNIATSLSSFFTNVVNSVNNVAQGVFSFFQSPLLSIQTSLSNVFNGVTNLPSNIANSLSSLFSGVTSSFEIVGENIVTSISKLFVPDDDFFSSAYDTFASKVPFVKVIYDFFRYMFDTLFVMSGDVCPEPLVVNVKYAGSTMECTILDLSWYEPYKPTVDLFLSGFIIVGFVWSLFRQLPGIINGVNNDAVKGITDVAKGR